MKVVNVYWFTEMAEIKPIGIVTGVGAVGERKAYIGTGLGLDSAEDVQHIAENGAKLPLATLEEIVKDLKS